MRVGLIVFAVAALTACHPPASVSIGALPSGIVGEEARLVAVAQGALGRDVTCTTQLDYALASEVTSAVTSTAREVRLDVQATRRCGDAVDTRSVDVTGVYLVDAWGSDQRATMIRLAEQGTIAVLAQFER